MKSSASAVESQDNLQELHFHNQGMEHFNTQNFEAAVNAFRTALHHNVDRADTQYMIGICYSALGQTDAAIDHLQIAGILVPAHTDCWIVLARLRLQTGRTREALSAVRQARKYAKNPHDPEIIKLLTQCIAPIKTLDIGPQLVEEVTRALQTPEVNSDKLVYAAQKLLLNQAIVKKLLKHYTHGRIKNFNTILQDKTLNWGSLSHPLFMSLMSQHLVWHRDLENLFQALRAHILERAVETPLSDSTLWPNALHFIAALAQQCFIGEYAYDVVQEEHEHLKMLVKRIQTTAPSPYDIVLIACYRPLYSLDNTEELTHNQKLEINDAVSNIIRTQILEPAEEKDLIQKLDILTSIDDEVSLQVKEQYESNPYPRWISTAIERPSTLRKVIQSQFPYLDEANLPDSDFNPETLIAGCGTGRHPIENALLLPGPQHLAIDITAASLAYAQRKSNEMGVDNIKYGLADILNLHELNRQFDLIHCGGVLHHMRDPMAGWTVLKDILKSGGFMMIALYSEIARKHVVEAREYIAQHNLPDTPEGIRTLRRHIKNLPDTAPMKWLMNHRDFYSLSECRDFLFHVQEHRFTALNLKESIDSLDLRFLGFQQPMNPGVLEQYRTMFPQDPHALNLENWHEYELENPEAFIGMYQFWLQKP